MSSSTSTLSYTLTSPPFLICRLNLGKWGWQEKEEEAREEVEEEEAREAGHLVSPQGLQDLSLAGRASSSSTMVRLMGIPVFLTVTSIVR